MRIDSASMRMDSARSYHTSKTSVRRFEITDYQTGLTDVSTKGQKTPEGEDTAQNTGEQENTAENTAMTAKRLAEPFSGILCRWNMRSSASEQTLVHHPGIYGTLYFLIYCSHPGTVLCMTGCRKTVGVAARKESSYGNTCIGCSSIR